MGAVAQDEMDQRIGKNISDWVAPTSTCTSTRSFRQKKKETSALVAAQLKKLGYDVTDHSENMNRGWLPME